MKKFRTSLAALGLLGAAGAIPAAASTINLNTGTGTGTYTITSDTLVPGEGTTVNVVTSLGGGWINNLSSEWIAPSATQAGKTEAATGGVTYDTIFALPVGFTAPSLSIDLAADDWVTISLNGTTFYTGPTSGQWTFDTVVSTSAVLADLVAGSNTLQFVVANTGNGTSDLGGGPTGLDAQVSVGYTPASSSTPEPSTVLPLAIVALLGGFALRRRTRSAA